MTARDYEHDKWVPWYVEDTVGWLQLSLAARGAMAELVRKFNAKGQLSLRSGLPSLAFILRLKWEGELEPAIGELVAAGKITWDGSRFLLSDPEYGARRRRSSADRMRDKRARDAGDVTGVTDRHVTRSDAGDGCSSLVSSSLSDLDLRSEIASEPPTQVRPKATEPGKPPEWFLTAVDVVAMATGIALPPGEAWLRYDGHRETKGMARTPSDAQYWLTSVMVPEARELLRVTARDKDRDAKFKPRGAEPEKPPPLTKAQEKAFADQLSARLQAQKAAGGR